MTTFFSSLIATLTFISIFSMPLFAQDDFKFEQVSLVGSGCPTGSTSTVTSPDQASLSVLFSQFSAQVPQSDGQNDNDQNTEENSGPESKLNPRLSHKVCNMVITARIPQGHKLNGLSLSMDYRGSSVVQKGSIAAFRGHFLEWRGPRGALQRQNTPLFVKRWVGEASEDWTVTEVKRIDTKSPCAARDDRQIKFVLRNVLVARIGPQINPQSTSALIALDTADYKGKLNIKVDYNRCGPGNGNGNGGGHGNGHGRGHK